MTRTGRLLAAALVLVVAACGDDDDGEEAEAETTTTTTGPSVEELEEAVEEARTEFCAATEEYVVALDRYGRLLTESEPTVGDVTASADDIIGGRDEVEAAAAAYDAAVEAAEEAAAAAAEEAAAAAAEDTSTSSTEPTTTTTFPPLASDERIEAVETAERIFEDTTSGVDESTPLAEATVDVTSAAFQLQVAWGLLFAEAGCIEDPDATRVQVATLVRALQTDLADAGFYTEPIDGIYGPATLEAVRELQAANGLPVTGLPDGPTQRALQQMLANQESASIAGLQGLLAGLGYYAGPIDGVWSTALDEALKAFQTDAGQEPTGTLSPETLAALQEALALIAAGGTTTTTATPTTEPSTTTTDTTEAPTDITIN